MSPLNMRCMQDDVRYCQMHQHACTSGPARGLNLKRQHSKGRPMCCSYCRTRLPECMQVCKHQVLRPFPACRPELRCSARHAMHASSLLHKQSVQSPADCRQWCAVRRLPLFVHNRCTGDCSHEHKNLQCFVSQPLRCHKSHDHTASTRV